MLIFRDRRITGPDTAVAGQVRPLSGIVSGNCIKAAKNAGFSSLFSITSALSALSAVRYLFLHSLFKE